MIKTLRLSDLSLLSVTERDAAVRELARGALARPNGEMEAVEARIRAFERKFEMSSATMEARLESGDLQETADVASWVIALDVQRRMRVREA